jgi:hypothetical protein
MHLFPLPALVQSSETLVTIEAQPPENLLQAWPTFSFLLSHQQIPEETTHSPLFRMSSQSPLISSKARYIPTNKKHFILSSITKNNSPFPKKCQ